MAYSYSIYTVVSPADNDFVVAFPYLDTRHIHVLVNTVEVAFSWLNSQTVEVDSSLLPVGASVRVERRTPIVEPLVHYSAGAPITKSNLDRSQLQGLYVAQESWDSLTGQLQPDATGNWDGKSKRIINLADPVEPQDAVTKVYADAEKLQAAASATASDAARVLAEAARDTAVASKDSAVQAASDAEVARAAAVVAKDEAVASLSGTLKITDIGTGPGKLVALTEEGKLPAVDGSNLVNLPTSNAVLKDSATGAAFLPSGTTGQRPASPVGGMIRHNASLGINEQYDVINAVWTPFSTVPYIGLEYLVVAGGGGAAGTGSGGGGAGGGGAGGLRSSVQGDMSGGGSTSEPILQAQVGTSIAVIVGAGGAGAATTGVAGSGGNSSLGSIVALGGGGSRGYNSGSTIGVAGGSGAGGGVMGALGGAGTAGQGFAGGAGYGDNVNGNGGGGGAGVQGSPGIVGKGGVGGNGVQSNIKGGPTYFAGGGGGGGYSSSVYVPGGLGGGGTAKTSGVAGDNGVANSGGGAGGSVAPAVVTTGAAGGSGVVIVRYKGDVRATGGVITQTTVGAQLYTVHTFTTSGTFQL